MTMATDNNNKVLNVPNLRFPEFTEEWKETKIGDITSKVGSGVTPKGGSAVYKTSGHLFIRSQNVGNGRFLLDDVAYIDEATHKKQINTELKDGDVLLNITGASIGRTTVVNKNVEGGNVNQHVCIIRLLEDYSPNYICNYLLSYGGQKQIDSFQAGGNREGLNFEQIRSIKFSIPSFREQSKIASLLSLLEERIATQNKIIEDLKKLKVAITQKISKDNSNRKVMLSELLTERYEKNKDLYPVHSVSVSEGIINQVDFLGRSFAANDISNYNVVCCGDIVYTKSPTGDFPYGIVKMSSIDTKVSVSPLYGVYHPSSEYVGIYLHNYFSNSLNAKNYLHKLIQKGAKNTINITNKRFLENEISLPNETLLKEYSLFISAFDLKIKSEQKALLLLQKQKEYLLQQMFI
ncbi:MAG: restriction endonuclease subunit S [Alphaproteobacteria bacterium]|nr:restriction endonuclease subunit S [Alphaproteobacteria bacterium]